LGIGWGLTSLGLDFILLLFPWLLSLWGCFEERRTYEYCFVSCLFFAST